MAARAIAADGKVGDEPHGHSRLSRGALGVGEASRSEPLKKQMEVDIMAVLACECIDLGAARVLECSRPIAPVPCPMSRTLERIDRFESGMVLEGAPASRAEGIEFTCKRCGGSALVFSKSLIEHPQDREP